MTEDLLHFIWKLQLFNHAHLKTESNEEIKIIKPGMHNQDAGPDFLNSRILINDTMWAGNIEIHKMTSDWVAHNHQFDPAYENVILHVVYYNNEKETPKNKIPILSLKNRIPEELFDKYYFLKDNHYWIPCQEDIHKVKSIYVNQFLERALVERLEEKSKYIIDSLEKNKYDWRACFYQILAKTFGFKVNSIPFEHLAMVTPLKIIGKHKNQLKQIEALLLGQAGFLNQIFSDEYPAQLKKEYEFLSTKYNLQPMGKHEWKFLRLRPANFPTIRISQFAHLLNNSSQLLSKILETQDLDHLVNFFDVEASEYWNSHYKADKRSKSKATKNLGKKAIENIIINTVVPFLFTYGKLKKNNDYKDRALHFLEHLKPEHNSILKKWTDLGMENKNAFQSQSLLYLKKAYCNQKRCLQCGIGTKILTKN